MSATSSFFKALGTIGAVVITAAAQAEVERNKREQASATNGAVIAVQQRILNLKAAIQASGKFGNSQYRSFVQSHLAQATDYLTKYEMSHQQMYLNFAIDQIKKAEENASFFMHVCV